MADKKIKYDIEVDSSDAIRGLRDFSRTAERAGRDVAKSLDDTASAGDKARAALKAMAETMDAELREAAAASDALKGALGEMSGRVDVDQVVADLNRMGVTFDEIRLDADKFATTLRDIDGIRVQQLNDGLDNTKRKLGEVRDNSDQSRSVLANLAGNAAQDLGELGGVVGTLGVGIGQLAEYAVDGNIALSNLAKVAGPMALLAGATALIGKYIGEAGAEAEKAAERTQTYRDAIDDLGAGSEATASALQEMSSAITPDTPGLLDKLGTAAGLLADDMVALFTLREQTGGFESVADAIQALDEMGFSFHEIDPLIRGSKEGLDAFIASLEYLPEAEGRAEATGEFLTQQWEAYHDALTLAGDSNDYFRRTAYDLNNALDDQASTLSLHNTLWAAVVNDLRDGVLDTENAVDAYNQLQTELDLTNAEMDAMAQGKLDEKLEAEAEAARELEEALVDAGDSIADIQAEARDFDLAGALAEGLDVADVAVDFQGLKVSADDAIEDLQTHIDEHGAVDWSALLDTSQIAPEDLSADLIGLVQSMRDSVQEGVVGAFEIGGTGAAQHFLDTFRNQIVGQGIMTEAEFNQLIGIPADGTVSALIEPIVDMQAAARATAILDAIAGTGATDPRIAALQIALATGNVEAELAEVASLLLAQELGIPVDLTGVEQADIDAVQGFLDNNVLTASMKVDTSDAEDDVEHLRDKEEQLPMTLKAEADTSDAESTTKAFVDKPRTTGIKLSILELLVAEALLNTVARDRTSAVNVDVVGEISAERTLEQLARDRYADVFVRLHGAGAAAQSVSSVPGVRSAGMPASTAATSAAGAGVVAYAAPAALAVPTSSSVSVTINAGVVGSRFDVQRAVMRAMRQGQRLNGQRAA